jgi:hypothetical protein
MAHLDTSITSYGQKKGHESNWQFDSWPLKVENLPDFLTCRWRVTYRWKAFNKCYNFVLDLTKLTGVPTLGISRFALTSFETKWHLSVGPVPRHKVYYKGEGGGFPQFWAVVRSCLLVVRPCTKNVQTTH